MFILFRQSRPQSAPTNRRTAKAPTSHVRGAIECLESRCMLSVAQSPIEMRGPGAPSFDHAAFAAARQVASLVADAGDGDTQEIVASMLSDKDIQSTIAHFKSSISGVFIPPRARQAEHSAPPTLIENGLPRGPWPEVPGWELDGTFPAPRGEPHDWSDAAGYMEIDNRDQVNTTELFVEEATDQDTRDVLEMLSSLRYLPSQSQEISTSAIDRALEGSLDQLTNEPHVGTSEPSDASSRGANVDALTTESIQSSKSIPTMEPAAYETNFASRKPADRDADIDLDEGGMVALVRGPLSDDSAEAEAAPIAEIESLLEVPVQMDSAYGKYQAFEVSSAENAAPAAEHANPSEPEGPAIDGAPTSGADLTPDVDMLFRIAGEDVAVETVGDDGQVLGDGVDEDEPPPAAFLGANDPKTRTLLSGAATALVFASITRAARGPRASKSDGQSAEAFCRPKPDSKTAS